MRPGGNRDLAAPGSQALCAGSRGAGSALQLTLPSRAPVPSPRWPVGDQPGARLLRRAGQQGNRGAVSGRLGLGPPARGGRGKNLLKRRKKRGAHRAATGCAVPVPAPRERGGSLPVVLAWSVSPGTPRSLTSTTELRTASDTLCRSSAAVPGLLSRLVNLRTSAMAAAGRSRRACSVPRAGAAAAAPRVYTPAGRPHRSSAVARPPRLRPPPPAAPPSLARSQPCPAAAAAPSPREPELRARAAGGGGCVWRGRVRGGGGSAGGGPGVTREEGGSGNRSGSARS